MGRINFDFKIGSHTWIRTWQYDELVEFQKKWESSRSGEFWYQSWIPKKIGETSSIEKSIVK